MKKKIYYQKTTRLPMGFSTKEGVYIQSKTYFREDKPCPLLPDKKKEQDDRMNDIPWYDF